MDGSRARPPGWYRSYYPPSANSLSVNSLLRPYFRNPSPNYQVPLTEGMLYALASPSSSLNPLPQGGSQRVAILFEAHSAESVPQSHSKRRRYEYYCYF